MTLSPVLDRLRAVVFDLDDTLYLERNYAFSGYQAVAATLATELGWNAMEARRFVHDCRRQFCRGDRASIFNQVLAAWEIFSHRRLDACIQTYRHHSPQIRLLRDADECLTLCQSNPQLWLALITDGDAIAQQRKVEALGLDRCFHQIICTGQWGREFWKPHPRAFLDVEQAATACGPQCIYIADNPHKDFLAPTALGWQTIRVRRPRSLHFAVPTSSDRASIRESPDLRFFSPSLFP